MGAGAEDSGLIGPYGTGLRFETAFRESGGQPCVLARQPAIGPFLG